MNKMYLMIAVLLGIFYSASGQPSGNAVLFNGSTDFIQVPDNPALKPASVTIEAWIKVNAFTGRKGGSNRYQQPIVFKERAVSYYFEGYHMFLDESTHSIVCGVTSVDYVQKLVTTKNPINLTQWYHVAMTADKDSLKLYINGVIESRTSTGFDLNLGNKPLYIGKYGEDVWEGFFNGYVDDVRIWNGVRSAAEIASNYNKELTGSENNLVAYYNMNTPGRGAGITVPNTSSLGSTLSGITGGSATTPIFTSNAALPIKLTSFKLESAGKEYKLIWTTSLEVGSKFFEIQHSNDGSNFSSIGNVNATGNSVQDQSYSFIHTNPSPGNNYYRLKMVDTDNNYEYSTVISSILNVNDKGFNIYPNPVREEMLVQIPGTSQFEEIEILSKSGQLIFKEDIKNQSQIRLITNMLKTGSYVLRLKSKTKNISKLFMKE